MKKELSKFSIKLAFLIVLIIGFSSCKNQKKLTELSDPEEETMDNSSEIETEDEEPMEEVEERVVVKEPTKEAKIHNYFSAISSASSTSSANASIQEALSMFSNSKAPVLIVIYKEGNKPSYDEPTTIEKYLNYLKDTKNNKARVEEMVFDGNGKIKELVLRK